MKAAILIERLPLAGQLQALGDLIGLARGGKVTLPIEISGDGETFGLPKIGQEVGIVDGPQIFARRSAVIGNIAVAATVTNIRHRRKHLTGNLYQSGPVFDLQGQKDPIRLKALLKIRKLCRARG